MSAANRIIRLFVSSTFADMRAERNALQREVFPRLRELCRRHGYAFQALDLRWGVSEEAGADQQTMRICLEEIRRCQDATPRPNFLILLGHRYGWRPLPWRIAADEYEAILGWADPAAATDLNTWYRRDDNAIPADYVLQPRRPGMDWDQIELRLRSTLMNAAGGAGLRSDRGIPFGVSATEQEIQIGALAAPDAAEHVFCFLRDIWTAGGEPLKKAVPPDGSACAFVDSVFHAGQWVPDDEALQLQEDLRARLERHLGPNVYRGRAVWTGTGPSEEHIPGLCCRALRFLGAVILREIKSRPRTTALARDRSAHNSVAKDHVRHFTGRVEILDRLARYAVRREEAPPGAPCGDAPLLLIGPSGSGKSAVLARVADGLDGPLSPRRVVSRFVGATPESSVLEHLLRSILIELRRIRHEQTVSVQEHLRLLQKDPAAERNTEELLPDEGVPLVSALKAELATLTYCELVLIVDGLDHLSSCDLAAALEWIPPGLPERVRVIVSCTMDTPAPEALKVFLARNIVGLPAFTTQEGDELLNRWLGDCGRRLQPDQRNRILTGLAQCPLPLFLRLAFEEARLWPSWLPASEGPLGCDLDALVLRFVRRLSTEDYHGPVLVQRLLGYLLASRHGLSEDECVDLLSADAAVFAELQGRSWHAPPDKSLPMVVWARLSAGLGPYLRARQMHGTNLLSLRHAGFARALLTHGDLPLTLCHQGLLDYYAASWTAGGGELDEITGGRVGAELPWQLIHVGSEHAVAALLGDPRFVEGKLKKATAAELREDYARSLARPGLDADDRESLMAWSAFAKENLGLLTRHPDLTFQTAANEPTDSPVSISARRLVAQGLVRRPWFRVVNGESVRVGRPKGVRGRLPVALAHPSIVGDRRVAWTVDAGGDLLAVDFETGQSTVVIQGICGDCVLIHREVRNKLHLLTLLGKNGDLVVLCPETCEVTTRRRLRLSQEEAFLSACVVADGRLLAVEARSDQSSALVFLDVGNPGAGPRSIVSLGFGCMGRVPLERLKGFPHAVTILGNEGKEAGLIDLRNGEVLRRYEGHESWIRSCRVDMDRNLLITGSLDGTVGVFELGTGRLKGRIDTGCFDVYDAMWAAHIDSLVVLGTPAAGGTPVLRVIPVSGDESPGLRTCECDSASGLVLLDEGSALVVGSHWNVDRDGRAQLSLWELDGLSAPAPELHDAPVVLLASVAGGARVVSVSRSNEFFVWSVEAGKLLRKGGEDRRLARGDVVRLHEDLLLTHEANWTTEFLPNGAPRFVADGEVGSRPRLWRLGDEREAAADAGGGAEEDAIVDTVGDLLRIIGRRSGKVLWEQGFHPGIRKPKPSVVVVPSGDDEDESGPPTGEAGLPGALTPRPGHLACGDDRTTGAATVVLFHGDDGDGIELRSESSGARLAWMPLPTCCALLVANDRRIFVGDRSGRVRILSLESASP